MPSFYLTYWLIYFQAFATLLSNLSQIYFPCLKITKYHYLNSAQLKISNLFSFYWGIVTNLTDPE